MTPTEAVYKKTKLLKTELLYLEQCKFIYQVLDKGQKCNVDMKLLNDIYKYYTRITKNLFVNSARTNIATNNPIAKYLKSYNKLPSDIKQINRFTKSIIT